MTDVKGVYGDSKESVLIVLKFKLFRLIKMRENYEGFKISAFLKESISSSLFNLFSFVVFV